MQDRRRRLTLKTSLSSDGVLMKVNTLGLDPDQIKGGKSFNFQQIIMFV